MKMKKWILAVLFVAVVFPLKSFAASNFVVYYIDMQEILNKSPQGKEAKKELEAKIKETEKKLKKLVDEINALKKDLSNPLIKADVKKKKEQELQTKILLFNQLKSQSEAEVRKYERELTGKIVTQVMSVVVKYQKQHHIPMIVERNEAGIIAADPKYDLTEKILKLYSKKK